MTPAGESPPEAWVLALNAGSSSLKFGAYRFDGAVASAVVTGEFDYTADGGGRLWFEAGGVRQEEGLAAGDRDPRQAVAGLRERLASRGLREPVAIGHRIVHGGAQVRRHAAIDAPTLRQLEVAAAFAPLHVPPALELVRAAQEGFPSAVQAACLDTAFHAGMPEVARTLPIPRELREQGIERYGFHGLSCESIVRQLGDGLPRRVVIAHLGSGASVTAVLEGRSVDTSMGFTPSGGLVMGTRCGDIDPGVLAYLMRERGYDAARIEDLVDHRSGLLGLSGFTGDMRALHAAAATRSEAQLAIAVFVRSVSRQVAAMTVALGGLDLLVFTGGIGEHDAAVRDAVVSGLGFLGVAVEPGRGPCEVRMLRTDEEREIATHAFDIAGRGSRT